MNPFRVSFATLLALAVTAAVLTARPPHAFAQATTAVRGVVTDPQGSTVPGATVLLRHTASGLERLAPTDLDGKFEFGNLPVGTVTIVVTFPGFQPVQRRIEAPTASPVDVAVSLWVATLTDQVTVTPLSPDLDQTTAGTRHAVTATRIERLPAAVSSRGLEAVLVSFPGFSQNANGAIHPRGAHNQLTFVLDGFAISDQLTGAFANSLDVGVVQTAEVITGNIPAEFGSKVSAVAVLNSRSGLGSGRRLAGSVAVSLGGFGTAQSSIQMGGERGRVAYFGSVTGMRTSRFLDQVSLDNLHNSGHFGRGFGRIDVKASDRAAFRLHGVGGQSRFELANLRSQHKAGQDQRQQLSDMALWTSYVRMLDPVSTIDLTVGARTTSARLLGSSFDTPVTATQDRRLSTMSASVRYTTTHGGHLFRVGADLQRFPVREAFAMAITDVAFNVPGSPGFNPELTKHDLTRGGSPFRFSASRAGSQASAFAQTTLRVGHASINLGVRHDEYHFLVSGRHLQPRIGVAYQWPGRDLVIRASYNRNYQTPPNENLLLSSSEEASQLAPPSVRAALGSARRPLQPERQDAYEAGAQFPLGPAFKLDVTAYRKDSRDQQDNNNFFDTGIIFPTSLAKIRVTGAETRLTMVPRHGISGTLSATTGRAISSPPFTGGLFLGQDAIDLLSAGPFAIDHDQRLSIHGTLTWDPVGPVWVGSSVRYDSGLVANPSDPDVVAADPDFADLLPYVDLAGTTPRVRPRTVVDFTAGIDFSKGTGARTWSLAAQVTNLTNRTALYNFQSVFVGTRLIQPRTFAMKVIRHF